MGLHVSGPPVSGALHQLSRKAQLRRGRAIVNAAIASRSWEPAPRRRAVRPIRAILEVPDADPNRQVGLVGGTGRRSIRTVRVLFEPNFALCTVEVGGILGNQPGSSTKHLATGKLFLDGTQKLCRMYHTRRSPVCQISLQGIRRAWLPAHESVTPSNLPCAAIGRLAVPLTRGS